jgi:ubiquinone/menaquinone biosynthesis C-methylase UbiE
MLKLHRSHGSRFGSFDHPERYDRWANRFNRGLYERVASDVAAAGLADGSRVLDVGTGPGRVPLAIARVAPGLHVEGLDLSPEMVSGARRNAVEAGLGDMVAFTVGDVADLPYADASFDLIVSTMSQHHWRDPTAGLRELRRVLRPGGRVWIYDFRFALGRAASAARAAFTSPDLSRTPLRTGWVPIRFLARLAIDPADASL